MHSGKAANTLISRTPGSRLTGYYSTMCSLYIPHLLQWAYLQLYFKGNRMDVNIHSSKLDCPLRKANTNASHLVAVLRLWVISFYMKCECFTLLYVNALIRFVNSSTIARTPCCTLNYPCHLKHAYLFIHKIVFCLFIQNNNFLTNKNVGCPAAQHSN